MMPQKPVPSKVDLEDYICPIDKIENMTDLDFFPDLPDDIEDKIESEKGDI